MIRLPPRSTRTATPFPYPTLCRFRRPGLFDLIVIDGLGRTDCVSAALPHVKPDGLILFDKAGRRRYRATLESCRLPRLLTSGLTACLPYPDPTLLLSPAPGVLSILAEA